MSSGQRQEGLGYTGPEGWPGVQSSEPAAQGRGAEGRERRRAGTLGERRRPGGTSSSSSPSQLPSSGCCSAQAGISSWRRGQSLAYPRACEAYCAFPWGGKA